MARSPARIALVALAGTALGVAAFGLGNPPTDPHAKPQPAAKAPSKPVNAPPAAKPAPERAHPDEHAEARPESPKHTEPVVEPKPKSEPAAAATAPNADAALQWLREGNQRWAESQSTHPNTGSARREDTSRAGQKPFATILTCADSRVPAERIFDCGVGDLFVVRVAGNVMSGEVAGTIEYGAAHLNVPLLVVMGHTKCGAVAAAVSAGHVDGNIGTLVEKITPAVDRARQLNAGAKSEELTAASVKENVWQGIFDLLRTSPEVRLLVQQDKVRVVGAVYDISTGKVEWFGEHPWQDALVQAFQDRAAAKTTHATVDTESPH